MKVEFIKTSEILPYYRNPRNNDSAIEAVAESIQAFGFRNPILIDQKNTIICGHTRWKSALKLNLKECPCIRSNGMTDQQIKAFRIADNRLGELAEWNYALLKDEFEELDTGDFNMDLTGFNEQEIEEMMTVYGDEYQEKEVDENIETENECPSCHYRW